MNAYRYGAPPAGRALSGFAPIRAVGVPQKSQEPPASGGSWGSRGAGCDQYTAGLVRCHPSKMIIFQPNRRDIRLIRFVRFRKSGADRYGTSDIGASEVPCASPHAFKHAFEDARDQSAASISTL